MRRWRRMVLKAWSLLLISVAAGEAETPEQRTARYLESIRNQPSLLLAFLRDMPKGGDLHNHLVGAVYAESYIDFAARDGLCVDRVTAMLLPPPCSAAKNQVPAATALTDPVLYRQMIDAYSMRDFQASQQPAHDHFFDAFLKFDPATEKRHGEMLAEVVARAGAEHVVYLELMTGPARPGDTPGQRCGLGPGQGTPTRKTSGSRTGRRGGRGETGVGRRGSQDARIAPL